MLVAQDKLNEAEQTLGEIRRYGGFVLRSWGMTPYQLRLYNGERVPIALKKRLAVLQPFVLVLLRKLASE